MKAVAEGRKKVKRQGVIYTDDGQSGEAEEETLTLYSGFLGGEIDCKKLHWSNFYK